MTPITLVKDEIIYNLFKQLTMQKSLMLVLAGVAIELLIAPDKGSATQRKVSDWLTGAKDDAKSFLGDAAEDVKSKANSVRRDVNEAKDGVKEEAEDAARKWS